MRQHVERPVALQSRRNESVHRLRIAHVGHHRTDIGVRVARGDRSRVAALVLTQDGHVGHGYILNGPEALSAREQVETLSDVLGRSIEFVAVTPEQAAQEAIENGTPAPLAAAMQNLNELFRASRAGVIADDIENLTGIAPRTFRDWSERHIDEFRAATKHNTEAASPTA